MDMRSRYRFYGQFMKLACFARFADLGSVYPSHRRILIKADIGLTRFPTTASIPANTSWQFTVLRENGQLFSISPGSEHDRDPGCHVLLRGVHQRQVNASPDNLKFCWLLPGSMRSLGPNPSRLAIRISNSCLSPPV